MGRIVRRAFVMTLKAGAEDEYKRRHDAIWPELQEAILASGVETYSIFRHGLTLFAYQERDEDMPAPDAPVPVMWRWWREMAPLMESHPDTRPVQVQIEEVFHLSAGSARRTGA